MASVTATKTMSGKSGITVNETAVTNIPAAEVRIWIGDNVPRTNPVRLSARLAELVNRARENFVPVGGGTVTYSMGYEKPKSQITTDDPTEDLISIQWSDEFLNAQNEGTGSTYLLNTFGILIDYHNDRGGFAPYA